MKSNEPTPSNSGHINVSTKAGAVQALLVAPVQFQSLPSASRTTGVVSRPTRNSGLLG